MAPIFQPNISDELFLNDNVDVLVLFENTIRNLSMFSEADKHEVTNSYQSFRFVIEIRTVRRFNQKNKKVKICPIKNYYQIFLKMIFFEYSDLDMKQRFATYVEISWNLSQIHWLVSFLYEMLIFFGNTLSRSTGIIHQWNIPLSPWPH